MKVWINVKRKIIFFIFDEADKLLPPETQETLLTEDNTTLPKKRKSKGRRPLPAYFPGGRNRA